ncbi:hypothetical protein KAT51_01165, partial [bacterium]|nr:hypothetical protein [bacterium]
VKKLYLRKLPQEMITGKRGSNKYIDLTSSDSLTNDTGWAYIKDMAEVRVNLDEPLGRKWGEYADQVPSEW